MGTKEQTSMSKRTSHHGLLGMGVPIAISLVPAAILFGVFYLVPIVVLGISSFADWNGFNFQFIGFSNFTELFADTTFWRALGNTVLYAAVGVFIQVPLGVLVGILLSQKLPGWQVFRAVLFLPFVVSGAAFALVYAMFYNPRYGLLNGVLRAVGLPTDQDWLYSSRTALPSIAATFMFIIGFIVLLVMAEISSIPGELYEAAEIDGASPVQRHLFVTLPLLRNVIGTVVLLSLLGYLGLFDLVYILTSGGPADSTVTLVLYGYRAYVSSHWGYANAVGLVIIALGLVLIVSVRRIFRIGEQT
jgi:raffinose/stachyose/melibiose transport system permease protein